MWHSVVKGGKGGRKPKNKKQTLVRRCDSFVKLWSQTSLCLKLVQFTKQKTSLSLTSLINQELPCLFFCHMLPVFHILIPAFFWVQWLSVALHISPPPPVPYFSRIYTFCSVSFMPFPPFSHVPLSLSPTMKVFLPLCETHLHCSTEGKAAAGGEEMYMNSFEEKKKIEKAVWPVI